MKDTILFSLIKSVRQHRLLFWICSILLTLLYFSSCCYNQVRHYGYEASAKLYPLVMTSCQDQFKEARVNPCCALKRVLASEDLQKALPISERKAARQFDFHETDDHCIEIISYDKNAETAIQILNTAIQQSNAIFWTYTSSGLSKEQGYTESVIKDYYLLESYCLDTCELKKAHLPSTAAIDLHGQLLCFDIIEHPHIVKEPSVIPLIARLIFSFILGACFSCLFVWVYSNLKHNG